MATAIETDLSGTPAEIGLMQVFYSDTVVGYEELEVGATSSHTPGMTAPHLPHRPPRMLFSRIVKPWRRISSVLQSGQ